MTDETTDQAPEQSVEQRIASKFGFPPAATTQEPVETEAAEGAQAAEPEFADVEWGGKNFRVPKDLLEPISKASDYTRKTQELADQRRSVEHIQTLAQQSQLDQVFAQSIAAEQQELGIIDAYLQQATKLDWTQMTSDQMLRTKIEVDSIKERRQGLKEAIAEKRSAFDKELKVKIDGLRKSAWDMAVKKIGAPGEEAQKTVAEYGLSKGLTESELQNALTDPRSAEILWEAAQFQKIKAGTQQAAEKATKAPPTLKPGAASERMPQSVAAKLNFNKAMKGAQTSAQKANVIEQRLAGMFGGK